MMCRCDKCKFVFESVRLLEKCPDCGYGPVRKATDAEIGQYKSDRMIYGPMPIFGTVKVVQHPVLISVENGCAVYQMRLTMAPATLM